MNLEQLRGFVEIAGRGNFTRAAEALHLAQPSLSRQISTLERDLGTRLFDRGHARASLTAAGEALLPLARRMLADAQAARRELAELAGLRSGSVRIGATPTLCISLVAEAIGTFHAEHPGIDLYLSERGARGLIEELNEGAIDLAVLTASGWPQPADIAITGLNTVPLLTEELVVVSSSTTPPVTDPPITDPPPAGKAELTLQELARLPQLLFHDSYDLRVTMDAAFDAAGLQPKVVIEGGEMDAVLRFVERGIGVAVVPAMVLLDRPGLRSFRLTEPGLSRTVSLAHRSGITPSRAVETMRRTMARTAAELSSREPNLSSLDSGALG